MDSIKTHFYPSQAIWEAAIDAMALWGESAQMTQAMAECGELVAAIGHYHQRRKTEREEVLTELADVYIMLCQISLRYTDAQLQGAVERSLARLTAKIAEQREKGSDRHES